MSPGLDELEEDEDHSLTMEESDDGDDSEMEQLEEGGNDCEMTEESEEDRDDGGDLDPSVAAVVTQGCFTSTSVCSYSLELQALYISEGTEQGCFSEGAFLYEISLELQPLCISKITEQERISCQGEV